LVGWEVVVIVIDYLTVQYRMCGPAVAKSQGAGQHLPDLVAGFQVDVNLGLAHLLLKDPLD